MARSRLLYLQAEMEVLPRDPREPADLCVPKTSSTSCDQAIFVDQATNTSLFSDAVVIEIDRFG